MSWRLVNGNSASSSGHAVSLAPVIHSAGGELASRSCRQHGLDHSTSVITGPVESDSLPDLLRLTLPVELTQL